MRLFDVTMPTPAENLALDEALLFDASGEEALRLWESPTWMVVLGRSSRHAEEAHAEACRDAGVPILRRVSGGATILTGPGCLMYAVVLDLTKRPELLDLTKAHRFVLGQMVEALRPLDASVSIAGTSDLAVKRPDGLRKFSGNSVRRVRSRLLYHGTLLYDFDLPRVGRLLRTPPRQPDYRERRGHEAFLTNLAVERSALVEEVGTGWSASPATLTTEVVEAANGLVADKYAQPGWNELR
ncbi:putative lipoate-protein ligase A [Botrimarina colliarenosi]|uniref:Putative lipoate-protein ligase A n=1 Tax=Botrimarina colliarenosi TaxID=2528001 RepID=A0A5C6ACF5_9BACT|nr:lipoate--protein ligase family protein [Botrimarina colliarenosi]TWT96751.1 putative lipoate-protein ligase A [Botrimarina colliarenosi]